jgi:GNAT superfamily N-acetyltransferase
METIKPTPPSRVNDQFGREQAVASTQTTTGPRAPAGLVPIQSLSEKHRSQITAHLLELDERDRYLRFGFVASDEHVSKYAHGLDFERDEILGITNRKMSLIAMAHLAYTPPESKTSCAEFGVSVTKSARGRGYGARLFERASMDASNKGITLMFIHALSENSAMLTIARRAGAVLERYGSETEAFLRLPPASLNSRISEIVEDHYAQIDYRLKAQSMQLHNMLAAIRGLQCGWQIGGRGPDGS